VIKLKEWILFLCFSLPFAQANEDSAQPFTLEASSRRLKKNKDFNQELGDEHLELLRKYVKVGNFEEGSHFYELDKLDLSYFRIEDCVALKLSYLLKIIPSFTDSNLTQLIITHCQIGPRVAKLFARALKGNKKLQLVDFSYNPIQVDGAIALIYTFLFNESSLIEKLEFYDDQEKNELLKNNPQMLNKALIFYDNELKSGEETELKTTFSRNNFFKKKHHSLIKIKNEVLYLLNLDKNCIHILKPIFKWYNCNNFNFFEVINQSKNSKMTLVQINLIRDLLENKESINVLDFGDGLSFNKNDHSKKINKLKLKINTEGVHAFNNIIIENNLNCLKLSGIRPSKILIELIKSLNQNLIKLSSLKELYLERNKIDKFVIVELVKLMKNKTLSLDKLILDENNIRDDGAEVISEILILENSSLKILGLRKNNIGKIGIEAIACKLRKNSSLIAIYLDENHIGDDGIRALLKAFQNQEKIEVAISNELISNEDEMKISNEGNTSLEVLSLRKNKIGDLGIIELSDVLKNNHSFKKLILDENIFGASGINALKEGLAVNDKLTFVLI